MDAVRPDNLRQKSDAELVRLLVAGNHDAMTVIFDRYYRLVMSVALRMIHDVAEAEEVVQIVFTQFFQKANLFASESSPPAPTGQTDPRRDSGRRGLRSSAAPKHRTLRYVVHHPCELCQAGPLPLHELCLAKWGRVTIPRHQD